MDPVDKDLEVAELDASLSRPYPAEPAAAAAPADKTETGEAIEHIASSTSSSASSVGAAAAARRPDNMMRLETQRDQPGSLERNETAMSRIYTQRSQHEGTVGEGVRSRPSKRPMMPMGGGKPYPPSLPAREEYVVEFDGPDDPLHGQNWSLRKKWVPAAGCVLVADPWLGSLRPPCSPLLPL
jgi:DHA1 family multidrug resistance protein-like MFS transporter